jgi:hypothetical protein
MVEERVYGGSPANLINSPDHSSAFAGPTSIRSAFSVFACQIVGVGADELSESAAFSAV